MKNVLTVNALVNNNDLACKENFEFYDWFAVESSLERRFKAIMPKVKFLVKEKLIDGDTVSLWLKNNAVFGGGTYDDVRFNSIEDKPQYLGGFCFQTWGFEEKGNAFFWIIDASKKGADRVDEYCFSDWKEMKAALKNNEDLRAIVRKQFNKNYEEVAA